MGTFQGQFLSALGSVAGKKIIKNINTAARVVSNSDSAMAQIASAKNQLKAQAIREQRDRKAARMAGGLFNKVPTEKILEARKRIESQNKTSFKGGK